jgi:AAA family ATP:ADP antiporter
MSIVLFACLIIALVYWWTNRYVVNQPGFILTIPNRDHLQSNSSTKLSLKESLLFIMRSPYLGLIAFMVIGYGISINMVEVSWKAMLKLQYPEPAEYQAFMGIVQTILGVISLFVAVFVGGNIIRRYGWYASAQLTPIVLGLTSLLFFVVFFLFPDYAYNHSTLWQIHVPSYQLQFIGFSWQIVPMSFLFTPLALLVFFGTIHNIACKTMKYCLFDTTKEMAYIPLDNEAKIKGKAAVDLVGARFGKSGASWTQLALIDLVGAGSILDVLPLLFPCIAFIVIFWFFAVRSLNKRFVKLQNENSLFANH